MGRVSRLYQFSASVTERVDCTRIDKSIEFELLIDAYTVFDDMESFYEKLEIMYNLVTKSNTAKVTLCEVIEWEDGDTEKMTWSLSQVDACGIWLQCNRTGHVNVLIKKENGRIRIQE